MKKTRLGNTVLLSLCVVLIYAVLKKPDIAIGYMRSGLALCAQRLIPSLFPFAVLSSLFVDMGGAELLGRIAGGIVSRLFGISRAAAFVPVLGMLCGFPVGAIAAVKLYRRGHIREKELQRLLIISGIPGSAFLVSAVGISMWSSQRFGAALYFIQIITSVLIGVGMNLLFPLEQTGEHGASSDSHKNLVSVFCDSVGDCAQSMLRICGFVVFFASSVGTLCSVLEDLGAPPLFKILTMGFFEMTGAVSLASQLGEAGALLTSLFVGWSGLSVHFQVLSVCRGIPLSTRAYFVAKAIQGVLSALLVYLYIRFFGLEFSSPSAPAVLTVPTCVGTFISGLFCLSLLLPFLRKKFL